MACYPADYDKNVSELLQAPTTTPRKVERKKIGVKYWFIFGIVLLASLTLTYFGTAWSSFMFTYGGVALIITAAVSLQEVRTRQ